MRILVVSDIHGNWPALAAIDEPHDVCLCLGDLVDYGPDSAPCVRWAMEHAHYAIRGNHDHGVAQGIDVAGESGYRYLTRVSRPQVWDTLGADERRYLLQLPVTQRLTFDGKRFLMVHATPRDPLDEYLMKDPATWARRVQNSDADIVLVGHSHMQFNLMRRWDRGRQSRQRRPAPRRRPPRRLRRDRRQQDRAQADRLPDRRDDRADRGVAPARARQADHDPTASASAGCPDADASSADPDPMPMPTRTRNDPGRPGSVGPTLPSSSRSTPSRGWSPPTSSPPTRST